MATKVADREDLIAEIIRETKEQHQLPYVFRDDQEKYSHIKSSTLANKDSRGQGPRVRFTIFGRVAYEKEAYFA